MQRRGSAPRGGRKGRGPPQRLPPTGTCRARPLQQEPRGLLSAGWWPSQGPAATGFLGWTSLAMALVTPCSHGEGCTGDPARGSCPCLPSCHPAPISSSRTSCHPAVPSPRSPALTPTAGLGLSRDRGAARLLSTRGQGLSCQAPGGPGVLGRAWGRERGWVWPGPGPSPCRPGGVRGGFLGAESEGSPAEHLSACPLSLLLLLPQVFCGLSPVAADLGMRQEWHGQLLATPGQRTVHSWDGAHRGHVPGDTGPAACPGHQGPGTAGSPARLPRGSRPASGKSPVS